MPVSESYGGAEIESGPACRHGSNVVLDAAFRAQTWKLYVPGVVGCQTHVLLVLQSWPSDQNDPSLTKNLKVYGPVPPKAAAVHVTGVFALTGNDRFADSADTVSGAGPVTRTGPAPSHASWVAPDPAFRSQTWKLYVPPTDGVHVQVLDAPQSRPTLHWEPSNTRNL